MLLRRNSGDPLVCCARLRADALALSSPVLFPHRPFADRPAAKARPHLGHGRNSTGPPCSSISGAPIGTWEDDAAAPKVR